MDVSCGGGETRITPPRLITRTPQKSMLVWRTRPDFELDESDPRSKKRKRRPRLVLPDGADFWANPLFPPPPPSSASSLTGKYCRGGLVISRSGPGSVFSRKERGKEGTETVHSSHPQKTAAQILLLQSCCFKAAASKPTHEITSHEHASRASKSGQGSPRRAKEMTKPEARKLAALNFPHHLDARVCPGPVP